MKFKIPTFFLDDSIYLDLNTRQSTRFAWVPMYIDEPVKTIVWLEQYTQTQCREVGDLGYSWKTKHRRSIGNNETTFDKVATFFVLATFFGFILFGLGKLFSIF